MHCCTIDELELAERSRLGRQWWMGFGNLIKGWIIASSMLYLGPRLAHLTNLVEVFVRYAEEFVPPTFQTHEFVMIKIDQVTLEVHRAPRGLESRKQGLHHRHPWQELLKSKK